jgi:large subunit ribosomal protein L4
MIELPVRNLKGETVSTASLDERVWDIEPNVAVLHQAVVAQQANARAGTASTLTRGRVRGSTKKHHRQKGTGMARQGTTKAPHWKGGGVVFGPHPRDWSQDLPKKMRKLAMRSALSAKVDDEAVVLVESWSLPELKTRAVVSALGALSAERRAIVVLAERDRDAERAGSNLSKFKVVTPGNLNLLDVLQADHLIVTTAAAELLTERLLQPVRRRKTTSRLDGPTVSLAAEEASE